MFKLELLTFENNYDGFYVSLLAIDTYGDSDRSMFMLGKRDSDWFLEIFYLRITPS